MKSGAIASAAVLACCFAAALPAAAQTSFQVISGNTSASATFDRPYSDFSDMSPSGVGVHYDTYTFTASVSGDYIFNTTAAFDSFVFMYEGSFNPADPLSNGLAGNDDTIFGNTFYASGFEVALTAGTTYIYVTTGFDSAAAGAYSTTIAGPAAVTAVPEVETYALMALGLGVIGLARTRRQRDRAAA